MRGRETKNKRDTEKEKTYERVNVRERDLLNSKPIKNKTAILTLGLKVKSFKYLFNIFLFCMFILILMLFIFGYKF